MKKAPQDSHPAGLFAKAAPNSVSLTELIQNRRILQRKRVLRHRLVCADCAHDYFVAFSCKGRGVCPSCNTRRMVDTAAHLTDHLLPRLPVRQWVLSVPKRLRHFMQRDGAVLNMVLRVITHSLVAQCPGAVQADKAALHIGAVAFIHRFGSSLKL